MIMWTFVTIAAVMALPVIIGFLMPVRYEGRSVVEYERSPQDVWDALQDVEAHPMTGVMMKSLEELPDEDGRPAWKEDMGHGEVITVTTTEQEPPHRMIRMMSSGAINMTSRWEYTLEPSDQGCRVTLAGITDIERGTWHTPVFRVMMVVGGGVKKGLDIQLDMVASTLGVEAQRAATIRPKPPRSTQ